MRDIGVGGGVHAGRVVQAGVGVAFVHVYLAVCAVPPRNALAWDSARVQTHLLMNEVTYSFNYSIVEYYSSVLRRSLTVVVVVV